MSFRKNLEKVLTRQKHKVFVPEIKNKKCKHDWIKLKTKGNNKAFLRSVTIEFEYLFCPKCNSTAGDEINY